MNNPGFPPNRDNIVAGFDPLIGVSLDPTVPRTLVGSDPKALAESLPLTADWVISRGGEYFFSPSISALKDTFAQKA